MVTRETPAAEGELKARPRETPALNRSAESAARQGRGLPACEFMLIHGGGQALGGRQNSRDGQKGREIGFGADGPRRTSAGRPFCWAATAPGAPAAAQADAYGLTADLCRGSAMGGSALAAWALPVTVRELPSRDDANAAAVTADCRVCFMT
jgi:hypothetical protein